MPKFYGSYISPGLIVMRPLGTIQMLDFNRLMGETGDVEIGG